MMVEAGSIGASIVDDADAPTFNVGRDKGGWQDARLDLFV